MEELYEGFELYYNLLYYNFTIIFRNQLLNWWEFLLAFGQAWTPTFNLSAPLCKVTGSHRSFGQKWPLSFLNQIS